jgi:dienelactone hydrolase
MKYYLSFLALLLSVLSVPPWCNSSARAEPLPGTQPLTCTGDPAAAMVAGLHKYLDRELAAAPTRRASLPPADGQSRRTRLRAMLGVTDQRVRPIEIELIATPTNSALKGNTARFKLYAVRWPVSTGVEAEGYLLEPFAKPKANVVAIPDADVRPEAVIGLYGMIPHEAQFARRLAENGCRVLVPTLIDRDNYLSGNPKLGKFTSQSHREFIHRMAFEMGRTMIGFEVQKVLAAVDWFCGDRQHAPVGVYGDGEGGRVALYARALDDQIAATAVVGAFGPREGVWSEPLDRNLWGCLTEFGDAEIARLIGRGLFIAPAAGPMSKGVRSGDVSRTGAAPGALRQITEAEMRAECLRVGGGFDGFRPVDQPQRLLTDFLAALGCGPPTPAAAEPSPVLSPNATIPDYVFRRERQFHQLVAFTQKLWRDSEFTRNRFFWMRTDPSSPEKWQQSCDPLRAYFWEEVIGKLPPTLPPNPRTRQVYDEPKWTGDEVMLDLYPDVFAYGILLKPKDLKPGERRPVVVCQHGLEGTPRSCIDAERRTIYNRFAAKLADLGYVVYCPQNPYVGENNFRQLQRKANPLKLSLFSFIVQQHAATLDWLATLPFVDADRIAFYGLSYGGKTAMRVPALLPRYCLSICSGDFNEWVGKCVSVDLDRSYMYTREYDMYEFDLGNTFNYAEMAGLIAPRPFMVERGHDDGVGTDEMVAYEYAKVRRLYSKLGLPGRTAIEFFPGGHQINGKGTFAFLKQHLGWPK